MHRPSWSILPSDIEMEQWALGVGSFGAVFRAKWQGSQVWTLEGGSVNTLSDSVSFGAVFRTM